MPIIPNSTFTLTADQQAAAERYLARRHRNIATGITNSAERTQAAELESALSKAGTKATLTKWEAYILDIAIERG